MTSLNQKNLANTQLTFLVDHGPFSSLDNSGDDQNLSYKKLQDNYNNLSEFISKVGLMGG